MSGGSIASEPSAARLYQKPKRIDGPIEGLNLGPREPITVPLAQCLSQLLNSQSMLAELSGPISEPLTEASSQ
jgi:hypothetical protein